MTNYLYGFESYFTIMANITVEEILRVIDSFDKQHYAVYEKVKSLPDDFIVRFGIKDLEGEVFTHQAITVGELKEFAKQIEEKRKPKE